MPELPEMDHYKQMLTPRLVGKTITSVSIEREKSLNMKSADFQNRVIGQTITSIERRAKYIGFHLSNGSILLLHLMLGGKLFFGTDSESPDATKQVTLYMGAHGLYFIGLRLGFLHLLTPEELEQVWAKLGPDPLASSFQLADFQKRLQKKRGRLKGILVDQSFIAGIGNRYSDEICFEAALYPGREGMALNEEEKNQLYSAIQTVLRRAIKAGGYLDLPIFAGDKETGGAEKLMKVHGRSGEACPRCGATIVEEKIASKKTSFCPNCQK